MTGRSYILWHIMPYFVEAMAWPRHSGAELRRTWHRPDKPGVSASRTKLILLKATSLCDT